MNSLHIFNELSEHMMLRIYSSREIVHPKGWFESKQHEDYDLWYIHEGKIEIRIQGQVHIASAGDLILFSPKIAYTAINIDGSCRFTFTHFDFGLGNHLGILDNFQLSGVIPSSLLHEEVCLFLDTYDQYKQDAPMSGIRLKGCLTILIAKLIECYGLGKYRGGFAKHSLVRKQVLSLQTLQPILDFIHEHLHQAPRIAELAKRAGMSEKYFILYFKKTFGVTPGLYIYQLKMNRAKELLYGQDYSIQQIAGLLGYPDPYSFSKAFKKYYKVPPSQFV